MPREEKEKRKEEKKLFFCVLLCIGSLALFISLHHLHHKVYRSATLSDTTSSYQPHPRCNRKMPERAEVNWFLHLQSRFIRGDKVVWQ